MPLHHPPANKTIVAVQLAIYLLAAAILIPAVTPSDAVNGGPLVKLAFLARVAVLVALAGWLLRKRCLGWSDVGLRRPEWRRFLIALPAGLLIAVLFAAVVGAGLARAGLKSADYSMFAPIRANLGQYLFWVLPVTIGTAAFGEELIFRGFHNGCTEPAVGRTRHFGVDYRPHRTSCDIRGHAPLPGLWRSCHGRCHRAGARPDLAHFRT